MSNPDPSWLVEAKKNIGIVEVSGPEHNPAILQMGKDAGVNWYSEDETPWCAVAVNAWLARAGYKSTESAMARSFSWGEHEDKFEKLDQARHGAIVVLWRKSPTSQLGHVGVFMGFNEHGDVLILGGNQSNSVNISSYPIERVIGYYWPVGAGKPWVDERKFLEKNTNRVGIPGIGGGTTLTVDQALEVKRILESPEVSNVVAIWPTLAGIVGVAVVAVSVYVIVRKNFLDKKEA